ncbi:MAG: hypothetical protein IPK50_23735 [Fibrobacterota bacterium]|nr:hypothetical protein [Fibrobacterota bacterium]QQS05245.1 MAG: hypothetical protein IPK50_23735 [Fibrobacterota bacterium]
MLELLLFPIAIIGLAPFFVVFVRLAATLIGRGRVLAHGPWLLADLLLMVAYPLAFILTQSGDNAYGCCADDHAAFAQHYMAGLLLPLGACGVGYFAMLLQTRLRPPLVELLQVGSQIAGLAAGVLVWLQMTEALLCIPIALWAANLLWGLWWHSSTLEEAIQEVESALPWLLRITLQARGLGRVGQAALFLVGGAVVLAIVSAILLLFRLPPDSAWLALTQTYENPLSELVHDCSEEVCTGMYLCTIGSHGHSWVVGPTRPGVRSGHPIRCTRQLLVANAFEESLEHRLPSLQRLGRQAYDRMGNVLDPNRALFARAWLCDIVHLAMLPAEACFWLWLILVEPNPHRLVAGQYLPASLLDRAHRQAA